MGAFIEDRADTAAYNRFRTGQRAVRREQRRTDRERVRVLRVVRRDSCAVAAEQTHQRVMSSL